MGFINRDEIKEKKRQDKREKEKAKVENIKQGFNNSITKIVALIKNKEIRKAEDLLLNIFKIKEVSCYDKQKALKEIIKTKEYPLSLKIQEILYNTELLYLKELKNSKSQACYINQCQNNLRDLIFLKINILEKQGNKQEAFSLYKKNSQYNWTSTQLLKIEKLKENKTNIDIVKNEEKIQKKWYEFWK